MKDEILLEKILKDNSYKITNPRMQVFKHIQKDGPMTMSALINSLDSQVDRVSVYRAVELYEALGIVKRIAIGWKYKLELSDIFLDHHHHISCISCGRIVAIKEDHEIEQIIAKLAKKSKFTMKSHQLELQGYCDICQS